MKRNSPTKSKTTLILLVSLLLLITSSCQNEDTPSCSFPKNAILKRIVSCRDIESECHTRECDDIASIQEEYEYDNEGKITKVMLHRHYENDVLTDPREYHLYEYNSKGQLVKIESYSAYRDGYWHDENHTYTYSDDGKMIKENIEIIEVGNKYKLYKYINNQLTRIEHYELNSDELEFYVLKEYDDSGNLIEETAFDKDGEPYNFFQRNVFVDGVIIPSYYPIWGYTKLGDEFIKTYDENENLILLESDYLSGSSKANFRYKYEYFN
jgi:hypothetical protein